MTHGDGGRTAAALAARRRDTQAALARVRDVLARMRREKTPVTVAGVSRRAGIHHLHGRNRLRNRARAIAGGIVHHDNFEIHAWLPCDRLQAGAQA